MKHSVANKAIEAAQFSDLSENVIYLMGLSFIVGSLFTVLMLILLDYMQRDRAAK